MKNILYAFLAVTFFIIPAFSDSNFIVINDKINVRIDSTVLSYSLGYLAKGEELEVVGEKYDWYRIRLPKEFICYVSKDFALETGSGYVKITGEKVNLRNEPSPESYIIGKAPKETLFPLVAKSNGWFKIQGYPYLEGWVHKSFLKRKEEIDLRSRLKMIMSSLSNSDIREKEHLHQVLIKEGEKVVPLLEEYIPAADINTCYSIISIFTQIGHDDPKLAFYFLKQIDAVSLKKSGIYLDTVQNIINPPGKKVAYFYLIQNDKFLPGDIEKAKHLLRREYDTKFGSKIP
jgi:uncharacterized protein YgiM (DUF1202 family)